MFRVFLGLGSNIGQREKYLGDAATELKKLTSTKVVWTSAIYESEPWGNTNQAKFFNAVIELETDFRPSELLGEIKEIERRLGRVSTERWGPREIDIDILLYDGVVEKNEELQIPHPELESRKFVLVPMREISPDVVHPVSGMTIDELAAHCEDSTRVVKSSHRIKL